MTNKLSRAQIEELYQDFVDNFDPSPYYADDDYQSLPDFDTWYELEDGGFGEVIDSLGLNPADYEFLPVE